jgi:ABC-type lipoprotein export system ATPase subunit
MKYKRIFIVGIYGSGKSTLAKQISAQLRIKSLELDDIKYKDNCIEWFDGHKFCIENRINFKDAKGFNLKEIGFILNKHKLTEINWKNNLSKSNGAKKHYIHNEKWTEKESVLYYNEIDCQIIYEIFKNLKKFQINI